ncbi:hypothetical protein ACFXG4_03670 [Nocardia sp. NPDC059246]
MIEDPIAEAVGRIVDAQHEVKRALDALAAEATRAHGRIEQLNEELGDA